MTSYASSSATQRLAAVREAIDKVLTSQRYQIGGGNGRLQEMARLAELRQMERELQMEVSRKNRNPVRVLRLGRAQAIQR